MTSEEFILWFKGFVEATETSTTDLSADQWKLIKEKLKAVRVKQLITG